MHPSWWSRFYEYRWAIDVANEYFTRRQKKCSICLDAGCGVEHPFKLELLNHSEKVIGIDEDPRIKTVPVDTPRLELFQSSLESFTYPQPIDCIFCISVLEHMPPADLNQAITNFEKLLGDGGCLVLTFDFPHVNLDHVREALMRNQFSAAAWDTRRDAYTLNGLNSQYPNPARPDLHVFRAFAVKQNKKV